MRAPTVLSVRSPWLRLFDSGVRMRVVKVLVGAVKFDEVSLRGQLWAESWQ